MAEKAGSSEKAGRGAAAFTIGSWQYSIRRLLIIIAAVILAVVLGLGGYFTYAAFADPGQARQRQAGAPQPSQVKVAKLGVPPSAKVSGTPAPSPVTPLPSPVPTPSPDPYASVAAQADPAISQDIVNVLLIGADYAQERADWHKYTYSDVMMVLAMNFKENKVDMISVPRDTYARIYNTPGKWKLNSSLYYGGGYKKDGPAYVMRSVENVLGNKVPINYYIGIDIPTLKDIVNAIGGVDYDVDVRVKLQGRVLKPGLQHLDGQQVVDYCRGRKGIDNDLGRVNRQKKMLLAIFRQLQANKKLSQLPAILQALQGKVHTNLSFQQLCALAVFGAKLDAGNIKMHTLGGTLMSIFNWNFVVTDQKAKVALLKKVYNIDVPEDKAYSYSYATREWALMQARAWISRVKSALARDEARAPEAQKISAENKAVLHSRINAAQAALKGGTSGVNSAKNALKSSAAAILKASGLPAINWFVNENPGKKRLTG